MRLYNSRIPEKHLVCYQTSQCNWVIIKMLYRCLRWCLLSWHRSRLGFFTPIVGEVSQGPLVWHPKFYLDFSKDFIWLEGGDLNFSFKRTLPFKIFFLWQGFYLEFTQDLMLVLEVLSFYLDSNQNAFHLEKLSFENLLNGPMVFEWFFSPFQNLSLATT